LRNTCATNCCSQQQKNFVFVGHINLLIFFTKNVSTRFNALQRASTRVAARLNAFKLNATQRAAVVEMDLNSQQPKHKCGIQGAAKKLTPKIFHCFLSKF